MTALDACPLLRSLGEEAWRLSDAPLADEFEFIGPIAASIAPTAYRAMAREAGQAVTSFRVRRRFVHGYTVRSIIDCPQRGATSSATQQRMKRVVIDHFGSADVWKVVEDESVRRGCPDYARAVASTELRPRSAISSSRILNF